MKIKDLLLKFGLTGLFVELYILTIVGATLLHFAFPRLETCSSGGFISLCFTVGFIIGFFVSIPGYFLLIALAYLIPQLSDFSNTAGYTVLIIGVSIVFYLLFGYLLERIVQASRRGGVK